MKTLKLIFTISALIFASSLYAQLKIMSNGTPYIRGHVYFNAYEGDGQSGTAYLQARDMSGSSSIALQLRTQNAGSIVNALRINPNGSTCIGTTTPYGILNVYGYNMKFDYNRSPLTFELGADDPRLTSDRMVVFYNTAGNDFIDIKCKIAHEYSDSLAKTNFEKVENSIEKLKKINGYTYNWKTDKNGARHAGLLAQQVERVIPEAVSIVDSSGQKSVAYSHIIPYLLEAIKEQQTMLDAQSLKIKELENKMEGDDTKSGTLKITSNNKDITTNAFLYQNVPNPFSYNTKIDYYIPDGVNDAILYVFNLQGVLMKTESITTAGQGSITINGSELKSGMYIYTLLIDGKEVDTKRMILTD